MRRVIVRKKDKDPLEDYISRHGYHFTLELATKVSKKFEEGLPDDEHVIGYDDLDGVVPPEGSTLGDIIYLANRLYSMIHMVLSIKPKGCISCAVRILLSEYPELPFVHFLEDSKWTKMDLDWENL